MNKKNIIGLPILITILLFSLLAVPAAEATPISPVSKVQHAAIEKKIERIKKKVTTKVLKQRIKKRKEAKAKKADLQAKKEPQTQLAKKPSPKKIVTPKKQPVKKAAPAAPKQKAPSVKETPQHHASQNKTDATSGASKNGREIGEQNKAYGKKLSDPKLSPEKRQKIISQKRKYNQSHH